MSVVEQLRQSLNGRPEPVPNLTAQLDMLLGRSREELQELLERYNRRNLEFFEPSRQKMLQMVKLALTNVRNLEDVLVMSGPFILGVTIYACSVPESRLLRRFCKAGFRFPEGSLALVHGELADTRMVVYFRDLDDLGDSINRLMGEELQLAHSGGPGTTETAHLKEEHVRRIREWMQM